MAQILATRRNQGTGMATRREHPMERMGRDVETLFDRLLGGWMTPFNQDMGTMRLWDFDVTENDKEITVRAEIPGFEPNELDVQINQDVLTIKAEKEQKDDQHEEYRSFYRSITLPPGINSDKVQATYHNGVLELHIPKSEAAQARHIKIQGEQATIGQQGKQATAPQAGNQGQPTEKQTGATASDKAKK